MNIKNNITIIFFALIISFNYYLSGILGVLEIILSLSIYLILTFFIHGIYKKITIKKYIVFNKQNFIDFTIYFLNRVSILIILITSIVGLFAYYQNDLKPAIMPIYTISNGDKIVIFQSMSHIGSEKFYNGVKENIKKYKQLGYTYYFEGVKEGSLENHQKFDNALGVKFDKNLYKYMSRLYGLTNQDNSLFLGLVNNNDKNIDIGIDEIISEYEKLKIINNTSNKKYSPPINASDLILEKLNKLNENQLKILRYINKSIISLIIKSNDVQSLLTDSFQNKELFEIILNKRNEVLSNEIMNSHDKKIIITYGLLHFDGILKILQNKDIKWQIKKIDYSYPLK